MGVNPLCLDIGTGTGLLSMMAAKSGVKRIVACEVNMLGVKISFVVFCCISMCICVHTGNFGY